VIRSEKSKYAEKELTKFLKEELAKELTPSLLKIKYIPAAYERPLSGKRFDVWSKGCNRRDPFAIWEFEIRQQYWAITNVEKLEKFLNFWWKPKVFLFQIFSPNVINSTKENCRDAVNRLKRKYSNRLVYSPVNIGIERERFNRMIKQFEQNKYSAKNYYASILDKELRKIVKESIKVLNAKT